MINPYFKDVLTNLDQLQAKDEEDTDIQENEVEVLINKDFCQRVEPYWFIDYILKDNNIIGKTTIFDTYKRYKFIFDQQVNLNNSTPTTAFLTDRLHNSLISIVETWVDK